MKERLKRFVDQNISNIAKAVGLESEALPYDIEAPKVKSYGDLSVNIAFHLGKKLKQNPVAIAEQCQRIFLDRLKNDPNSSWIDEISVAKPGFINFRFAPTAIASQLCEIHKQDERYGISQVGQAAPVLLEFVSANPTGPLTIAHGRQAAIGDTLARILTQIGYKAEKEFYLNDRGRQVRLLGASLWVRYLELFGQKKALPEDGYQGDYLIDLAKKLKLEKGDAYLKCKEQEVIPELSTYASQEMLKGIREELDRMRVSFDRYFSEKSLGDDHLIEKSLEMLRQKGVTYEADGAFWFQSTKFGDDKDRVLRKNTGELTYLGPDIAYHEHKFSRGFKMLVNLWGPDHHGYVARMRGACEALGHPKEALHILLVQLTKLFRAGKPVQMSTRKGEFVTLKELIDEVGADATRFFFLMRKVDSPLDFDLELAKQKTDDNPVFYVQYAHARVSSLLSFAEQKVDRKVDFNTLTALEELNLIKKLAEYPEVLIQAAERLEPYRVIDYLREVAAYFHRFYAKCRVVGSEAHVSKARLLLVDCVRIVLRNGLDVIGVAHPSSM